LRRMGTCRIKAPHFFHVLYITIAFILGGRPLHQDGRWWPSWISKMSRHVKSINANISASKPLRRSILVSKYTFSWSRNALQLLRISLDDYLCRDQIHMFILAMYASFSTWFLSSWTYMNVFNVIYMYVEKLDACMN